MNWFKTIAWVNLIAALFCLQNCHAVPTVLVSVAPDQFFVEKIADNTVHIQLLVPAGASAHTYEPTPKQMVSASQADIWFRIGEHFEPRAIQALKSHNPSLQIVDLRQGLDLIRTDSHRHKGCCPGSEDLHFWLSARLAQTQAETIAEALIKTYPQNRELYQNNLEKFQNELKDLDQQIVKILEPLKRRSVLVSHPAYAYFCRDYDLEQYTIEVEGKDPAPQQMTKLLRLAKELQIKRIFIQPQYSNKAAQLIAKEIGASIVMLDPYSQNYYKSMLSIANAFAGE
ncbi:MAG: zinc ABC transporter substrate-binding protein [Candidatus Protochlamydia sp.]|nr:zinc ABC transporter substrate-binding protein [Candidatus Protochlamydia sp.]